MRRTSTRPCTTFPGLLQETARICLLEAEMIKLSRISSGSKMCILLLLRDANSIIPVLIHRALILQVKCIREKTGAERRMLLKHRSSKTLIFLRLIMDREACKGNWRMPRRGKIVMLFHILLSRTRMLLNNNK